MAGNGWKLLEWQEIAINDWNGCKLLEWSNIADKSLKWMEMDGCCWNG